MRVLQLLHPLGHTLGPEPLPITTLTIARTIVTDRYFPVISYSREPLLPEPDRLDDTVSQIEKLFRGHVRLLADVVDTASHEGGPDGLTIQHRDHMTAFNRLDLAPARRTKIILVN